MTDFADRFHERIEGLYSVGLLSKTGTGRFDPLIVEITQHLGLDEEEVYVVSCARPNNLNIRLTQGKAQHRHNVLGLGVIPPESANGSTVDSGLKAATSFIGEGNAQYNAVGVVVKHDSRWVIGGLVEASDANLATRLQTDFPHMVIKEVAQKATEGQQVSLFDGVDSGTGADTRFNEKYRIAAEQKKPKADLPLQAIFHGCPGSGKSHQVKEWAKTVSKAVSIAFHPETTYSDFVGVFRPFPVYRLTEDEFITSSGLPFPDGEPHITYKFVPGPLLEAYCFAKANPEDSVALIIDELSRANASLVFGDMLQLLDRVEDGDFAGQSCFPIEPKAEIHECLVRYGIHGPSERAMSFPANLHIWSTMNRSDQNARQIDTAFLRRWTKKHMSYNQPCAYGTETVQAPGGVEIEWDKLRSKINSRLVDFAPEDKFIGPYFLPKRSLGNRSTVAEDLLGYLWNDVLKTRAKEFFKFLTLTEVITSWSDGTENPFKDISLT